MKPPPEFFEACKRQGAVPTSSILVVNVADQILSLFDEGKFVKKFPCSTSHFGIGQTEGSNCTPLGLHRITEKIGAGEPAGKGFKTRPVIRHTSQAGITDAQNPTRILWLERLRPG